MTLADTQTRFTASQKPGCTAAQRQCALDLLHDNEHIPPILALRIYANNGVGARRKALAAAHPACVRILGEDCFNTIACRYIERTPSVQADLNLEGAGLSDFLQDRVTAQPAFSEFPYLGDLARLEWLCHTVHYAEDDPPFDFSRFANANSAAQKRFRFRLCHSLELLQSNYPVMEIREANLSGGDATMIHSDDPAEYLVVSRPEFQARVTRVDSATFKVLVDCRNGKPLGDIADSCPQAAQILPGMIRLHWIRSIGLDG